MTLALIGKGLLLKGATPKTKDKQVPGIYIYTPVYIIFLQSHHLGFPKFHILFSLRRTYTPVSHVAGRNETQKKSHHLSPMIVMLVLVSYSSFPKNRGFVAMWPSLSTMI